EIPQGIGPAGAVLVGFLALCALTLATFAWHPLQRLERRAVSLPMAAGPGNGESRGRKAATSPAKIEEPAPGSSRDDASNKGASPRADGKNNKPKPGKRPEAKRAPGQKELGPVWDVELLEPPRTKAIDFGEAELDMLQERLESTLAEFKVEGDVAG